MRGFERIWNEFNYLIVTGTGAIVLVLTSPFLVDFFLTPFST